jgi:RNA ligase
MLITDLFPLELFNEMREQGYIRTQVHPTLQLNIAKYSEKAAYERKWNAATLACRGLIYNPVTMEVVARPWSKFFNYGESLVAIGTDDPVEVYDKVDGSLGIMYPLTKGLEYLLATVGSFTSEQAIKGSLMLVDAHCDGLFSQLKVDDNFTFLFEIVYPANRIVLDYHGESALYLLGAVNKEYGYYLGPNEAAGILGWKGKIAETFSFKTIDEALAADYRPNAEGYIIRSGSTIVKLKQDDYLQLHRIITNTNAKTVWRILGKTIMEANGIDYKTMSRTLGCSVEEVKSIMDFDQMIDNVPDEFYNWLSKIQKNLIEQFYSVKKIIYDTYYKYIDLVDDRKKFAKAVRDEEHISALFNLLDGKSISSVLYRASQARLGETI